METHWKGNQFAKKGNHDRSHQTVHAIRYIKNNYSEEGLSLVTDSLQATWLKDAKHKEEATEQVKQFHIDKKEKAIMKKRKGNRTNFEQQKLSLALSHQDECFSAIASWFLHWTLYPSFEIFRRDTFMQTIYTVAGEKAIRTSTMPDLKTHINAEWNAYIKFAQK